MAKPIMHRAKTAILYLLSGRIMRHKIIYPPTDKRYVLAVLISFCGISNSFAKLASATMAKNEVSAAGMALKSVSLINLPCCFFSFGSSVNKNAGTPILNMETSETCDGSSG